MPDEACLAERRRVSLCVLRDQYGGIAELARAIAGEDGEQAETIRSYLSQIINRAERKDTGKVVRIGQVFALRVEQRLGLPRGWLGMNHERRQAERRQHACPVCLARDPRCGQDRRARTEGDTPEPADGESRRSAA